MIIDDCELTKEEAEIDKLLEELEEIDIEKSPKIAHGIYIAKDTGDSIDLLGKDGLYYIRANSDVWKVQYIFDFGENTERYYKTREEAIDTVCKVDFKRKQLFMKYGFDIYDLQEDTKVKAEINKCLEPD